MSVEIAWYRPCPAKAGSSCSVSTAHSNRGSTRPGVLEKSNSSSERRNSKHHKNQAYDFSSISPKGVSHAKQYTRATAFVIALASLSILLVTARLVAAQKISEQEAYDIGVEAYVYFYPLISMDVTRRVTTNIEPGKVEGFGPMNAFNAIRTFPPADLRAVVRINFDTRRRRGGDRGRPLDTDSRRRPHAHEYSARRPGQDADRQPHARPDPDPDRARATLRDHAGAASLRARQASRIAQRPCAGGPGVGARALRQVRRQLA